VPPEAFSTGTLRCADSGLPAPGDRWQSYQVRRLVILLLAVALAAGVGLGVRLGLAVFGCRHGGSGSTPTAAVASFYHWCLSKPTVTPLTSASKRSTPYSSWYDLKEDEVVYGSGNTGFLLVGQRARGNRWTVLDGEGSGP